jgi:hypothetical protein
VLGFLRPCPAPPPGKHGHGIVRLRGNVGSDGLANQEFVMSINCDVVLKWGATPDQLSELGAALWRWCNRPARDANIYHCLDNQGLADLMTGKLPVSRRQTARPGIHFRDEASTNRQETIDSLRQDLPEKGIEDIMVDGTSWKPVELGDQTCVTA